MDAGATPNDLRAECVFDTKALHAAFGTSDVPGWLTDRLPSAFQELDSAVIDLRAGAATIDLTKSHVDSSSGPCMYSAMERRTVLVAECWN